MTMSEPEITPPGEHTITPAEPVPVEPVEPPPAPAPAQTVEPPRETSYIVLAYYGDTTSLAEDEYANLWQIVATDISARSAEAAWKQYAEANMATLNVEGETFVAVPSRSWRPAKVKPRTVTTLEVEE